jgi:hypothetical protein
MTSLTADDSSVALSIASASAALLKAEVLGRLRVTCEHRQRLIEEFERGGTSAARFPVFTEAPRKVHGDGHIEFQGVFYSVPPECARQKVWVRHQDRLVRIYYTRREPIALHAQAQPGAFHHRSPIAGSSRAIKAKSSAVAAGLRSVQVLDNNETVPPQQGSTPILAGAFPNHDGSKRMCGRYTRLHCGYVIR